LLIHITPVAVKVEPVEGMVLLQCFGYPH
jgi:hypothetical protein